jgi:hypothetical protein
MHRDNSEINRGCKKICAKEFCFKICKYGRKWKWTGVEN